jgi:hypothetical protein
LELIRRRQECNSRSTRFKRSRQIAFYVTLAVVTVLTFLRAKKGLLSNVNTEYHKKVIERLDALSKALLDEYDLDSPNHWSKHLLAGDAVRKINKTISGFEGGHITRGEV